LIYSTCSLEREENETVIENFAAENKGFYRVKPQVAEKFLTADEFARTFPPTDKTNGFFIAVFEKKRVFDKV